MLVVMQTGAPEQQVKDVCERIEALGFEAHPIFGAFKTVIGVTGDTRRLDVGSLESLPGVAECIIIGKPYKLAASMWG